MPSSTRSFASGLLGLALAVPALAAPSGESADRIWSGGPILTMNDAAMRAEAVAERDGRIIAVGARDAVLAFKGPETELIDLGGRTLLPGFYDAHGHVLMGGLQALSANLLAPPDGEVTDIASLQASLRRWMAENASVVEKVKLVVGFGYDNATLAEHRHPTRADLDVVSAEVPIMLIHQSGHLAAVNTKALEIAGVSAATPDPPGGLIRREPDGKTPNGVFEETAAFPVLLKLIGQVGAEGGKAFFRAGAEMWARFGYTTAEDGRSSPGAVAIMRQVADEGGLAIDVVTYPDVLIDRDFIKQNMSRDYVNRLRVAGAKLTIDGSPQGFTAWRDRPYYAPVGDYPAGYRGYAAATTEQVLDAVDWAYANGIQLNTHSNGEAASDLLIAAHTVAQLDHGSDADLRPVLIHGTFLREDQVDAYRRLGVFPSLFPMHTFYWGDWHTEHTLGPELAPNIDPTGWVRARGMRFSTHHDAPVAFPDSMRVLDATVTRVARGSGRIIGPDQRVDVITALKAMTLWPAWQHFEEANKGSIEVGKLADLVILSDDPTAVDPDTIDRIAVTETIKEGKTIYKADPMQASTRAGAATGAAFGRMLNATHAGARPLPRPPWKSTLTRVMDAMKARTPDDACPSEALFQLSVALSRAADPLVGR